MQGNERGYRHSQSRLAAGKRNRTIGEGLDFIWSTYHCFMGFTKFGRTLVALGCAVTGAPGGLVMSTYHAVFDGTRANSRKSACCQPKKNGELWLLRQCLDYRCDQARVQDSPEIVQFSPLRLICTIHMTREMGPRRPRHENIPGGKCW